MHSHRVMTIVNTQRRSVSLWQRGSRFAP